MFGAPPTAARSAFTIAISHVLRMCTEVEVRRIHAGRRVASMEHIHAIGDEPVRQSPHDAMDENLLPLNLDPAVAMVARLT